MVHNDGEVSCSSRGTSKGLLIRGGWAAHNIVPQRKKDVRLLRFVITNEFRLDKAHFGGEASDNDHFWDQMENRFSVGEEKMKHVLDGDIDDNCDHARSILKECFNIRINASRLATHFPCLAVLACFLQKCLCGACHILTLH